MSKTKNFVSNLTLEDRIAGGKTKTKKKSEAARRNIRLASLGKIKARRIREVDDEIILNRKAWVRASSADRLMLDVEMDKLLEKRGRIEKRKVVDHQVGK